MPGWIKIEALRKWYIYNTDFYKQTPSLSGFLTYVKKTMQLTANDTFPHRDEFILLGKKGNAIKTYYKQKST